MILVAGMPHYIAYHFLILLPFVRSFFQGSPTKNYQSFAALKTDGSVVAWGDSGYGGSTANPVNSAASLTSGVVSIASTGYAFAALKTDGSVVAWGNSGFGGSTANPVNSAASLTSGVVSIASTRAFAALKTDGSVVAWGDSARRRQTRSTPLQPDIGRGEHRLD